MHVDVFTDGWARGNPWPAGCGFVVYDAKKQIVVQDSVSLGHMTNNSAEYWGAIHGLHAAIQAWADSITLHMDSELVVKQLLGEYKVKHVDMKELFWRVQEILQDFSGDLTITHVPREDNKLADKLSNQAMDRVPVKPSCA